MDLVDDFRPINNAKRKSYEVDFDSLSQEAVERLMRRDADDICGILGVDVGAPPHCICC
jgi:ariadne-1